MNPDLPINFLVLLLLLLIFLGLGVSVLINNKLLIAKVVSIIFGSIGFG